MTWKRKIGREIYGLIIEKEIWRIITILEFQIVHRNIIVMSDINIRMLESLGQVIRMKDIILYSYKRKI
jgi:hypothetical protein